MIGPTKRKITRKEMQKDPLIDYYFKVRSFLNDNQRNLLIGLGGLVAVVVIIILLMNRSSANEEKASGEFGKVITIYNSGAYQQAIDGIPQKNIKGLKYIVEEYGSTESGETAKIFLAHAYLNLSKVDEAKKYYDDYSGSNKLLKMASYAGVATCLEINKKPEEAAEYYLKAANVSKDENNSPGYLITASKLFSQVNQKEKAKKILDQIKADFPNSQYAREYDRYVLEYNL